MPRGRLLLLATLYLVLVCAIGLLQPIRNALALKGLGAAGFYKAYLASAGVVLFLVPFGRLAARISARWLTSGVALWFVSNLVLFRALFPGGPAFGIAFYAWHDLFAAVLVSQFFLATQPLVSGRSAKTAYPFIVAGGSIGATMGGLITGFLVTALGVPSLLLVAAALTAVFALALPLVIPRQPHDAEPAGVRRRAPETAVGWRNVVADRQLRLIAVSVMLTVLVKQLVDYQFNTGSAAALVDTDRISAFQGKFNAATQWLPLVASAVLQPLLTRWGVGAALFMLPAAMLTTNVVVGIWGGLAAVATAKATQSTLQNSAERTGREIVYMPVPAAIKARAKPAIDVGVDSVAKALSAGAIFLVLAFADPGALAWTAAGVSVAWLALAWALRRAYVRALARAIATRDTTLDVVAASLRGGAGLAQVQSALSEGDPDRAAFALDLLARRDQSNGDPSSIPDLAAVLGNHAADISARRAAARALGRVTDGRALNALLACIAAPEPHPRLRGAALTALSRLHRRAPHLPIGERPATAALDHDLEAAARYRTASDALPTDGPALLRRAVEDAWQRRRENVFRDLALLYPPAVMDGCYRALVSETAQRQDAARDLLEEGLPRSLSARLEPVLQAPSAAAPKRAADESSTRAIDSLATDIDPWVRRCATAAPRGPHTGSEPMDDIDKVLLVQRVDVFREARSDHLALLAGIAEEVDVDAGTVLLREDEVPTAVHVVALGEVTLQMAGAPPLVAKPGEGFGALGVIGERPAMFTAIVTRPATLLRISRSDLVDLLVDSPELAVALLRGLAHRVDTLLARAPAYSPLGEV
jgi:AAA family ATP:ADP antiporter